MIGSENFKSTVQCSNMAIITILLVHHELIRVTRFIKAVKLQFQRLKLTKWPIKNSTRPLLRKDLEDKTFISDVQAQNLRWVLQGSHVPLHSPHVTLVHLAIWRWGHTWHSCRSPGTERGLFGDFHSLIITGSRLVLTDRGGGHRIKCTDLAGTCSAAHSGGESN